MENSVLDKMNNYLNENCLQICVYNSLMFQMLEERGATFEYGEIIPCSSGDVQYVLYQKPKVCTRAYKSIMLKTAANMRVVASFLARHEFAVCNRAVGSSEKIIYLNDLYKTAEKFPKVSTQPLYMREIVISFMEKFGFNHDPAILREASVSELLSAMDAVYVEILCNTKPYNASKNEKSLFDVRTCNAGCVLPPIHDILRVRDDIIELLKRFTCAAPVDPRYSDLLEKYNAIKKLFS